MSFVVWTLSTTASSDGSGLSSLLSAILSVLTTEGVLLVLLVLVVFVLPSLPQPASTAAVKHSARNKKNAFLIAFIKTPLYSIDIVALALSSIPDIFPERYS